MIDFKTEIRTEEEAEALYLEYLMLLNIANRGSEEEKYYCSKLFEIAEILKAIKAQED